MDEYVAEALEITEELEDRLKREQLDSGLIDEVALIRHALRLSLGIDPFRGPTDPPFRR